jgi:hypothetical protein
MREVYAENNAFSRIEVQVKIVKVLTKSFQHFKINFKKPGCPIHNPSLSSFFANGPNKLECL